MGYIQKRWSLWRTVWFYCGAYFFLVGCASTAVQYDYAKNKDKDPEFELAESFSGILYLMKPEAADDPRQVFPKVRDGLQGLGFDVVTWQNEDGPTGNQGTAFPVSSNGYFLTSAHLFENQYQATLWIENQRHIASVEAIDKDLDLALLKIPTESFQITPLSFSTNDSYALGMTVFSMGFPLHGILGSEPRLNRGIINANFGLEDDPNFVQTSAETQPGNSGSPLFNEKGQVVGMMAATLNSMAVMIQTGGASPQNINFAIKQNILLDFLNAHGVKPIIAEEGVSFGFDGVNSSIARIHTGEVPEEFFLPGNIACAIAYESIDDMWMRFKFFHLIFFDIKSRKIIFIAGQSGDNFVSTEDAVIQATLREVSKRFGTYLPDPSDS